MIPSTSPFDLLSTEHVAAVRDAAVRLHRRHAGTFGVETIERFIAEELLARQDSAVTAWLPVLAERTADDRLRALRKTHGGDLTGRPYVLFLCTHNAGRSQMAAGWMRALAGDAVEVFSGGSEPADELNRAAVEAMAEVGIDMAAEFPKVWTDDVVRAADVVVTMGCGDACPVVPGVRYEDWGLLDPAGQPLEVVRLVRDDIEQRVRALATSLGVAARR